MHYTALAKMPRIKKHSYDVNKRLTRGLMLKSPRREQNVMELLNPNNSTTQELNFDCFVEVVRCAEYIVNQRIACRGKAVKNDKETFDSERDNFTFR